MSKLSTRRLLDLSTARIEANQQQDITRETKHEQAKENGGIITRKILEPEKKDEILKTLKDTKEKTSKLLKMLEKWSLEEPKDEEDGLDSFYYSWKHEATPKHSSYRSGEIRKIKNQIVTSYDNVREILHTGKCISHDEYLSLLGTTTNFQNETPATTLKSEQVKHFYHAISSTLKEILIDMRIMK